MDGASGAAEALLAYVPPIARSAGLLGSRPGWCEIEASLVHVDVSGFTALSERLARRGAVGAEQLTEVIDRCFAALLEHGATLGGQLVSFGGDAVLLLFEGERHAARAAGAACRMRDVVTAQPAVDAPGGRITLTATIGVRTGPTLVALVGEDHLTTVVFGPAASEVLALEDAAQPGEVVVDAITTRQVPAAQLGETRRTGRLLLAVPDVDDDDQRSMPGAIGVRPEEPTDLEHLVPAGLRAELLAGTMPEHRRVAVAFCGLLLADDRAVADPQGSWSALSETVAALQAAATAYGVVPLAVDIDAGAVKVILTAGAPHSGGDDATDLLRSIDRVRTRSHPVPVGIGAAFGPVFAGDVGHRDQRSYTVMGDAVNLAARLQALAAPGTVLITPELRAAARLPIETVAHPTVAVRGRDRPVVPHELRSVGAGIAEPPTSMTPRRTPIRGRDQELEILEAAWSSLERGHGRVVELVGAAGIGRSRLVDALLDGRGARIVRVAGERFRAATPDAAARPLLLAALGLDAHADATQVAAAIDAMGDGPLADLVPWTPLIAEALGVHIPDTPATASIAARYRRARLHETVIALLTERWTTPTVVVVDAFEHVDEATAELLAALARVARQRPWLVLTSRPETDPSRLTVDAQVLHLRPLAPSAAERVAQDLVERDGARIAPAVLDQLVARSGGNPLFLAELVAATQATGGIGGLPDSIDGVVGARIDRLAPTDRRLLRQLAVLGVTIDRPTAAEVLELPDAELVAALTALDGLVTSDAQVVHFEQALVRDVAYAGLPFRERRRLHGRAVEVLAATGDAAGDLLSRHAFLAGRMQTAWDAAVTAGRAAARAYANADAARLLSRALEAAGRLRGLPHDERVAVAELLGDVRRRQGDGPAALAAYRRAVRRTDDPVVRARLSIKQARARAGAGSFATAIGTLTRAQRRLAEVPGAPAVRQRAHLLAWTAHLRQEQGRYADALHAAQQAIALAEEVDEPAALAHALRLLDWIHAARGEVELAVHSERALGLYRELGDLPNQAGVLNNLGGFAFWAGRWEDAAAYYRRAQALDERTGDVVGAAFTRNNLAEILADQGALAEAAELFAAAERTFDATAYTAGVAVVRMNLGRLAAHRGQLAHGEQQLCEALELHEQVGAGDYVWETQVRLAEVALLAGRDDEAARRADALGEDSTGRAGTPLLERIRAALRWRQGDVDGARSALARARAAATTRGAVVEAAVVDLAAAELAAALGEPVDEELRVAASRTLAVRGIHRVPWGMDGRLPGDQRNDQRNIGSRAGSRSTSSTPPR